MRSCKRQRRLLAAMFGRFQEFFGKSQISLSGPRIPYWTVTFECLVLSVFSPFVVPSFAGQLPCESSRIAVFETITPIKEYLP